MVLVIILRISISNDSTLVSNAIQVFGNSSKKKIWDVVKTVKIIETNDLVLGMIVNDNFAKISKNVVKNGNNQVVIVIKDIKVILVVKITTKETYLYLNVFDLVIEVTVKIDGVVVVLEQLYFMVVLENLPHKIETVVCKVLKNILVNRVIVGSVKKIH